MRYLLAAFFALFFYGQSQAALKFSPLTGRVVDNANVLSPQSKETLNQLLVEHETKTTNQVVVVTVPSLQGYEIEDYGYQLGRAWQIGQKNSNGVILLIAPNERRVRIEVGYGLEAVLTDTISAQIIQQIILPKFKSGDLQQGIIDGTQTIVSILSGKEVGFAESSAQQPKQQTNIPPWVIIAFIIFIIFIRLRFGIWFIPIGGFGSGGNSSDSFRGGGGSFGGGGSSGRW